MFSFEMLKAFADSALGKSRLSKMGLYEENSLINKQHGLCANRKKNAEKAN